MIFQNKNNDKVSFIKLKKIFFLFVILHLNLLLNIWSSPLQIIIVKSDNLKAYNETADKFKQVIRKAVDKYGYKGLEDKKKFIETNKKKIMSKDTPVSIQVIRAVVLQKLIDKMRSEATELVVSEIKKRFRIFTLRDDNKVEMWIYKEGIFIPEAKSFIKEFCRDILGKSYTSNFTNSVIEKIEADTFINQDEFFSNENIEEIAVKNGILNIFTGELSPFTPEKRFFNKLPVEYNIDAKCPMIFKHFEAVLKNKEDIPLIFEMIGFCLLKDYKPEKAFMLIGEGRNGKSKTLDLLKRFIGVENCASIPIQRFEEDRFSIAELHNKMANLCGDLSPKSLEATGFFKSLTGRDKQNAPRKFLSDISFVNYAKMIFCANELPYTYDDTEAFFRRWVLLIFPYIFVSRIEYDRISPNLRKKYKIEDTEIIYKISSPSELSGLLNEALSGLKRLIEQKDFSYTKSAHQVKRMWFSRSASFKVFAEDRLVADWDSVMFKEDLRESYFEYCQENNLTIDSDKKIKFVLVKQFGVSETRTTNPEGQRVYAWKGIRLRDHKIDGKKDQVQL